MTELVVGCGGAAEFGLVVAWSGVPNVQLSHAASSHPELAIGPMRPGPALGFRAPAPSRPIRKVF